MPLTQEAFEQHEIWATLDKANQQLSDALPNANGEEASLITTWKVVLEFTRRLREIEPWRFVQSGQVLTQLKQQLDALGTEIQPVIDDPTVDVSTQLSNRLDAYAAPLNTAPTMAVTSGHLSGVTVTVSKLNEVVREAIDAITDGATEQVDGLKQKISDTTEQLDKAKTDLVAQQTRIDTAITQQNEAFTSRTDDWSAEADKAVGAFAEKAEKKRGEQEAAAQKLIADLRDKLGQSEKMVSATARNVISTEYGRYAKEEANAAFGWSVAAVTLAVIGLTVAFTVIMTAHDLTVAESITKATISAAVLGTAGFMARESSGHRREARDAKRTQLDINTMRPFLATLPSDEQVELQRQLAMRVFNRPLANQGKNNSITPWSTDPSSASEKPSADDS